ncbi:MAG TPA: CBS domain-containing protein [Malonomonas sp.]
MKTVKDILAVKGHEVLQIDQEQTVYVALAKMAEADVGALVVVDGQGTVVGLMSERDYARKVILKGASSLDTKVKSIMESKVCYVLPGQSVEECMALVTQKRSRHLPVIENGKLLGLVSIGDLVRASISEKEFLINQLTNYIQSV